MPRSVPIPGGPPLSWSCVSRAVLQGDGVSEIRTGIEVAGREYHCRGTIVEVGPSDAPRFEFVLHGPDAATDARAVVATFTDFEAAVRAAPRLALRWVDAYARDARSGDGAD